MRTFVIGDIHGALKALQQIIAKLAPQPEDTLVFLGDYVDGWSQSAEVIRYLIDLESRHTCIFIKGNHDAWCEDWLSGNPANQTWQSHGGKLTVANYKHFTEAEKEEHLQFFRRMFNYHVDGNNRLFIHAGFSSMHGPQHEHYKSNYIWDRTLWEMALTMDSRIARDSKLYPKRLLLYNEIFIGHTPTLNYDITVPMHACNVWNIDTGAAFYGRLSAMDIDSKQIFQSDIVMALYRDEKGRNK